MSQVLELAKQGDAKAIAALINRSLNPQGINAKVMAQGNTLKVLLESLDTPDQNRFQSYILQGLKKIGVGEAINQLEIYGKQGGTEGYAWTVAFQISGDDFTPIATPQATAPQATAPKAQPEAVPASNVRASNVRASNIPAAVDNPFSSDASISSDVSGRPVSNNDVSGLDQTEIIKRAKQGDVGAIEAFVKSALADREGLESFVELNGNVLKVTIETKQFLDGPAFCGEFGTQLNALAEGVIQDVEVYKRKSEKTAPFLMKKMTLFSVSEIAAAEASATEASNAINPQRANGQSSAMRYTPPVDNLSVAGSRSRPTGVLVIAILYFLFGAFCTAVGGFTLIVSIFLRAAMEGAGKGDAAAMGMAGFIAFVMAGILLILGLGRIWIGVGLLNMFSWARTWAIRIEGFSLLRCGFALMGGDWVTVIMGMLISFPIWYYLAQGGMEERFH